MSCDQIVSLISILCCLLTFVLTYLHYANKLYKQSVQHSKALNKLEKSYENCRPNITYTNHELDALIGQEVYIVDKKENTLTSVKCNSILVYKGNNIYNNYIITINNKYDFDDCYTELADAVKELKRPKQY